MKVYNLKNNFLSAHNVHNFRNLNFYAFTRPLSICMLTFNSGVMKKVIDTLVLEADYFH